MTISMYQASVPVFVRALTNLSNFVKKGQEFAEMKKIDPEAFLTSRLYPNMFDLRRQIQVASDNAKGCCARLAGMTPPVYEDNEKTFADLYARIDKTIDFLNTLTPEQIDGSEEKPIKLEIGNKSMDFTGINYLQGFALPNFYFHVTTAYNILRHCAVELSKRDFLGVKPN